ncbi:hypothetical protein AKJ16_DCAP00794 [Drosera capensis]
MFIVSCSLKLVSTPKEDNITDLFNRLRLAYPVPRSKYMAFRERATTFNILLAVLINIDVRSSLLSSAHLLAFNVYPLRNYE